MIRNLKNDFINNEDQPVVARAEKIMDNGDELKIRLVTTEPHSDEDNVNTEVYLSGQKLTGLGTEVTEHILRERSYLRKGCTCAALAAEIGIQPYVLSAVINQAFKTNFNDFLNGYRIDYAKTLIKTGQAKILTLEGLSEQCGFNNRNSFTAAFKKHAGQTPSDFIKTTYIAPQ